MADERMLLVTDFETTGLEAWAGDEVLEFGVIAVDLDLKEHWRGEGLVRATDSGLERLRANSYVQDMHRKSGLLEDLYQNADSLLTIEEADAAIASILVERFPGVGPGEWLLAGSGTASFDRQYINKYMPRLRKCLHYSGGLDIGVLRRAVRVLGDPAWVPAVPASSGPEKVHRALADAQGHLEEIRGFHKSFSQISEALFRLSSLDK